MTEDEQERLLEQANPRYPTGERNQTMIRLMLNTGLRLAEVMPLKWRDLNLTTGKLMVRQGKGSKDRTLVGSGGRYRPSEKLERAPGGAVWSVRACVHYTERESVGAPVRTANGKTIRSQGRNQQEYITAYPTPFRRYGSLP